MSSEVTTVRQLAEDVGIPAEKLLAQLQEALSHDSVGVGLKKEKININHEINPEEKQKLLDYLQSTKNINSTNETNAPKKIILRRRKKINLVTKDNKDLVVTIRKKRTYRQREVNPQQPIDDKVLENKTEQETAELKKTVTENINATKTPQDITKVENNLADSPAEEQVKNSSVEISKEDLQSKKSDKASSVASNTDSIKDKKHESSFSPSYDKKDDELDADKVKKKKKRLKANIKDDVSLVGKTLTDFVEEDTPNDTSLYDDMTQKEEGVVSTKKRKKGKVHKFLKPVSNLKKTIEVPEHILVAELAKKMAVKTKQVMKVIKELDVDTAVDQYIDQDTATLIIEQFGHEVKLEDSNAVENDILAKLKSAQSQSEHRAPVVTIMGHVDHGKTSLLDKIRKSQVTEGEAGGITQHIGAYKVNINDRDIAFLDTPGHAAFTAMRARGADCTDIVILVVAADDGVMPQTIEAINHTKAANVPIIVAINKVDKPEADVERIRSELSQHEVISEEWGGDYIFVPVSAKSGEGIDSLLESILLQAEIQELKAPKKGPAQGVVLESKLEKGRGAVSTLLIQTGALKQGDVVVSGLKHGRIRSMKDENGKIHKTAGPSTPVEVLGMSGTLNAGDEFMVVASDKQARELVSVRELNQASGTESSVSSAPNLEDYFNQVQSAQHQTLSIILKTDVHGTLEALSDALNRISTDEISVNIASGAVGGITESDVNLALTTQAIIVGFNVRAEAAAKRLAEKEGVEIKYFNIIYDLIDTVKAAVSGLLPPEIKENIIGMAEVRDVFRSSRYGAIAGSMVTEGIIKRNANIRVLRDNVVIYEGELESLRRFKEDVQELRAGTECGIGVKNYNDIREKDQIEVFEKIEIQRKIS